MIPFWKNQSLVELLNLPKKTMSFIQDMADVNWGHRKPLFLDATNDSLFDRTANQRTFGEDIWPMANHESGARIISPNLQSDSLIRSSGMTSLITPKRPAPLRS